MKCIVCAKQAGYNRAVIDLLNGAEAGGLCVGCERTIFGVILLLGFWSADSDCAFCERDGQFALPRWEPRTVEVDGETISTVEYDVTDTTVQLCDEHLDYLRRTDDPPVQSVDPHQSSRPESR